ncbi:Fic family protein [Adlercreutzia sp. R25]|uniref:Fic family protein n=1 Tax=Adlercreutzia shanghongiae TaxID=3111773 RepID=UPI002DBD1CF9|nr:Fic family protein [Adlercreutzia sp. R25]MEC4273626.1 Fic family protein [Adlercreutzia sp. R25]
MGRSGTLVENLSGEATYRSFRPAALPPSPPLQMGDEMATLLVSASRALQRLDDLSQYVPNADLFISMYVRKEALLSSQIEGTQCTLEDILDPEANASADADISDVINYVKATRFALTRLQEIPLCGRLLKEVHEVLMGGVRGQEKNPGEFRRSQNWIGPGGGSLRDARYIPPNVEDMHEAIANLERFMNEPCELDPLVCAALAHYQFETIHPFLDGNGRVGRLLILLYLIECGLIGEPTIYISYFLKKNQVEYYDRMMEVRCSGNYEQWVRFFLEAVRVAALDASQSIERLSNLHEHNEALLPASRRAKDNLRTLFSYIEQHPIFTIKGAARALGLSYNGAATLTKKLEELGIIEETTNASRNRVFAYTDYLEILKEGTAPLTGGEAKAR